MEIQIYVGNKTLANNTLVSTLLVSFDVNLVLTLSLKSFCLYFLVIVLGISVSFRKSVKTNCGLSLLLWVNSYLYHKARKCHFASASTVCGANAPAEAHKCEHPQNIF
jgi:hypothetical protein